MGTMVEFAIVLLIKLRSEEDLGRSTDGPGKSVIRKRAGTPKALAIDGLAIEMKNRKGNNSGYAREEEGSKKKVEMHVFGTPALTKKIDYISLIMFSSMYIMFNGIYFNFLC